MQRTTLAAIAVPGHVCSSSGKCPLARFQLCPRNFGKFAPGERALGARAMGAPDRETLHAALRERYELQSREKSQATRSEADAALHGEVEAFLAQRPNNSSTPETLTKQFCAGRRGGCSWPEALVALALAFEGTPQPRRELADNERATQRMAGSRPTQPLETCSRVPAASLDTATFLEQYVAASRPVVLTGLLDDWAAVQPSSSRRWDLDYLWRKAGNSTVKAYISPDGEFEAVRRADEVVGGERVCAGCAADEQVLMRPAETEVRLEHFLWLVRGYENPERAAFYLQKHPLSKWRGLGLVEDVTPPPHERLAPFLRPLHELLWLATQCTVGPLHYDEHENLHAMVRGRKVFELFHPAEGAGPLYDGQKMRSKHLLWRWRAEAMRGDLMSLDPSQMEATHVPFSPVRLRRPDLAAHPAFTSSRRLLCEVGEGDVLYLPSYWWHEVTAVPTSDAASPSEAGEARPSCGLTASINYFFTPYYRKLSDLRTFAHESLYDFLRSTPDARSATRPDRWRKTSSTSRDASDREEL